jgi:hypothetical protein
MRDTARDAAAIRVILHRDWDPIGCGVPEDEYDSYLWPVYRLLLDGAKREEVASYLRWAADEAMTSPVPEERLASVLDSLFALGIDKETPPA